MLETMFYIWLVMMVVLLPGIMLLVMVEYVPRLEAWLLGLYHNT